MILHGDDAFSGHATLKLARAGQPAHILLYKPALQSELPYLASFQCLLALRTLEADDARRFDLASKPRLTSDVQDMLREHWEKQGNPFPTELLPQIASKFANGLGLQLRSIPVAIRVDRAIFEKYPALHGMQRINVDQQLQEAMQALSPTVKAMAPKRIIDANVAMSTAFAKSWSVLRNDSKLALPFHTAGYSKQGENLLELLDSVPDSSNKDRQVVDAWAKELGLDDWFETISKKA